MLLNCKQSSYYATFLILKRFFILIQLIRQILKQFPPQGRFIALGIYSYFEKGCRKKCTRQTRKVLWVVLSSLFSVCVFQRNLKEWQERPSAEAVEICLRVLKESNKSRFDSYSVRNSVLIISHITFRDCRVHMFSDNLSLNSCIYPDASRLGILSLLFTSPGG